MDHIGLVLLTTFLYGFRHGIDWDHIAAITDITSTAGSGAEPKSREEGPHRLLSTPTTRAGWSVLFLSTLYVLGHATMVVTLGSAALLAQEVLPKWVDPILERVVGATLLLLALWVFYSLVQYLRGRAEFRLRSRWMLVFSGVAYLWHRMHEWLEGRAHEHRHRLTQYSPVSAFIVGIIHGIGAETGSQVLLIAAVGGASGPESGLLLMGSFVAGLVLSNSLIAVVTATGFIGAQSHREVYVAVGVAAGAFSLVVGTYFITGRAENLPDLPGLIGIFRGESPLGGSP
jgi:cytochrome c biogenesis protein CcdA